MKKILVIICTERGNLEDKSILLVKSLREFGGKYSECEILSFSPRRGLDISKKTKDLFRRLNVTHTHFALNTEYADYPLANKPLVCSYVEENFNSEFYIFLDSDKIILGEPLEWIFDQAYDIALRPVDHKNVGSTGESDENHAYWQSLYEIVGVNNENYVFSTVYNERILEYWNTGLISIKRGNNVFKLWEENFKRVMQSGLMPRDGMFFVEQSVFAATVSSLELNIHDLSNHYNYPIHMQNLLPDPIRLESLDDITTLHYHRILDNSDQSQKLLKLPSSNHIKDFLTRNFAQIGSSN